MYEFVAGPPWWIDWDGSRWYVIKGQNEAGLGPYYRDRTGSLLHVCVWEKANGRALPDGYVVHHKDHDPANNHPENLELMTRAEHLDHHGAGREHDETVRARISDAQRSSWAVRKPRSRVCAKCGGEFWSTGQRAKFCRDVCREAHYRDVRRGRAA